MENQISDDPVAVTDNVPATILVVDDDPDLELLVTQKFRRQIRNDEFHFICVRSGEDALEKLRENEIDVLVTDIKLPGMDGLSLISRLKTEYPLRQVGHHLILRGHEDDQEGAQPGRVRFPHEADRFRRPRYHDYENYRRGARPETGRAGQGAPRRDTSGAGHCPEDPALHDPGYIPGVPGTGGIRDFRRDNYCPRRGRRFLRLLHDRRRQALFRDRGRLGQGGAGGPFHGCHEDYGQGGRGEGSPA